MQLVHLALRELPAFVALRERSFIEHCYGESNIISDADSRGYEDVLQTVCAKVLALQVMYYTTSSKPSVRATDVSRAVLFSSELQAAVDAAD